MAGGLDLFYWDTNLFYEKLKDERAGTLERQRLDELLDENKDQRNRICTSVITHSEVLPQRLADPAVETQYWSMFGSMHFFDIEIDRQTILLARKIRDFYFVPIGGPSQARLMTVGDSIHLATAIISDVTEFHTRDGKRKKGVVPLIGLPESSPAGKICGEYALKIISPAAVQMRLPGT